MTSLSIDVDKVRKTYGDYIALDDVSLPIRAGEFLTLLGPSGSGKTTLLMAIAGFTRLDSGSLKIGDVDVTRLAPNKRDIGVVFQNYALFPHMNVLENVMYPLRIRKVASDDARRRAMEALERVKLPGMQDRSIAALSGGQRQRVALARAIVFQPRVMLMDEPLSALDKNLREHMQFEIRRLHEDLGITTIYVTHDQREALTMSDRIAVMNAGRIEQIDRPRVIYHQPHTRFVAEFMGEANILAASRLKPLTGHGIPARQNVMVRAENFLLDKAAAGTDGFSLDGRIKAKAFRGENWMINLDITGERDIVLSIPAVQARGCEDMEVGTPLTAYVAAGSVHRMDDPS